MKGNRIMHLLSSKANFSFFGYWSFFFSFGFFALENRRLQPKVSLMVM